jgi:hypothetical protein
MKRARGPSRIRSIVLVGGAAALLAGCGAGDQGTLPVGKSRRDEVSVITGKNPGRGAAPGKGSARPRAEGAGK